MTPTTKSAASEGHQSDIVLSDSCPAAVRSQSDLAWAVSVVHVIRYEVQ